MVQRNHSYSFSTAPGPFQTSPGTHGHQRRGHCRACSWRTPQLGSPSQSLSEGGTLRVQMRKQGQSRKGRGQDYLVLLPSAFSFYSGTSGKSLAPPQPGVGKWGFWLLALGSTPITDSLTQPHPGCTVGRGSLAEWGELLDQKTRGVHFSPSFDNDRSWVSLASFSPSVKRMSE